MVNQLSDKDSCPEKHRDEGPLLTSGKDFCPERQKGVEGPLPILSFRYLITSLLPYFAFSRVINHGTTGTTSAEGWALS